LLLFLLPPSALYPPLFLVCPKKDGRVHACTNPKVKFRAGGEESTGNKSRAVGCTLLRSVPVMCSHLAGMVSQNGGGLKANERDRRD
jgi:hypothetical protein